MKIYDKVKWHFPEGNNCPSLAVACKHFIVIMEWLGKHGLLSLDGQEAMNSGIGQDFSLNSSLLTPAGIKLLDNCYDEWLTTVSYQTPVSTDILAKKFNDISGS